LCKLDHSLRVFEVDIEFVKSSVAVDEQLLFGEIPERPFEGLECALIPEVEAVVLAHFLCLLYELLNLLLALFELMAYHVVKFLKMFGRKWGIYAATWNRGHACDCIQNLIPFDGLIVLLRK
jgi:hypothetical protein